MSVARPRTSTAAPLVAGDYPLSAQNFRRIAGLLHEQSGIHLSETKAALVHSRLVKRLRALQLESFDDYCALIASQSSDAERMALLTSLTTNVTAFFREPHHFEHLRTLTEAVLAPRARSGGRVRIWTSACSTGEEAYSIAFTVLSVLPDAAGFDVKILASDIDPTVLETAQRGVYDASSVSRIPAPLRDRWLAPAPSSAGAWRVADAARELIVFKQLNLIGDWPMRGRFDVIFCRNTVIYFDEATQSSIWPRFRNCLTAEGRLYVGHSERVDAAGFESDGLTIYRLAKSR